MSENNDGLGDLPVGGVQPIPDAVRREFRRRMVFEAACHAMPAILRRFPNLDAYADLAVQSVDAAEALVDEIERREWR